MEFGSPTDKETMGMRKILAAAAATGIMALGLAAAPAQASTTDQRKACNILTILYTDFDVVDVADRGGARDGRASKADLRAIAAGKNGASPLLREAAVTVGGSTWFDALDHHDRPRSTADGFITRKNLRAQMGLHCQ
jgi:hypothetical protein